MSTNTSGMEEATTQSSTDSPVLATPINRLLGVLIDSLIVGAIGFIPSFLGGFIFGLIPFVGILLAWLWGFGVGIVVCGVYFIVLEGNTGQTYGKKAVRTKVVMEDGSPMTRNTASVRFLGRIVNSFTFGIGSLIMLWDPRYQTLHDKIGHTIVVEE